MYWSNEGIASNGFPIKPIIIRAETSFASAQFHKYKMLVLGALLVFSMSNHNPNVLLFAMSLNLCLNDGLLKYLIS